MLFDDQYICTFLESTVEKSKEKLRRSCYKDILSDGFWDNFVSKEKIKPLWVDVENKKSDGVHASGAQDIQSISIPYSGDYSLLRCSILPFSNEKRLQGMALGSTLMLEISLFGDFETKASAFEKCFTTLNENVDFINSKVKTYNENLPGSLKPVFEQMVHKAKENATLLRLYGIKH